MNYLSLKNEIKNILMKRKSNAEMKAEMIRQEALKDKEFLELENKIGSLTIQIAKANIQHQDIYELEKHMIEAKIDQDIILKKLGLSREMLIPNYICSKCNDTGIYEDNQCSCVKVILNQVLRKKCGIPLEKVRFEDCDKADKKVIDTMKKLYESYPNSTKYTNLLLSGDTGVGKTHITQALANAFIDNKGLYTIFVSAPNLNNEFLKYHTTFDENKLDFYEPYATCDVLIIDDLGTEPILKNVTKEYFLNLINERQLNHRLTIITTNLTNKGIINLYGERIFSRLFNKANCICLEMGNDDLRLKKKD